MPIETTKLEDGGFVKVRVTGTLTAADYHQFAPQLDAWVQEHGKLRLLVEMHDFHGWDGGGLWQDIKIDARHFNHFERIAMVGERKRQKWMAAFCKPLLRRRPATTAGAIGARSALPTQAGCSVEEHRPPSRNLAPAWPQKPFLSGDGVRPALAVGYVFDSAGVAPGGIP